MPGHLRNLRELKLRVDFLDLFVDDFALDPAFHAACVDHTSPEVDGTVVAVLERTLGQVVRLRASKLSREPSTGLVHGCVGVYLLGAGRPVERLLLVVYLESERMGVLGVSDPESLEQVMAARFSLLATAGTATVTAGGSA